MSVTDLESERWGGSPRKGEGGSVGLPSGYLISGGGDWRTQGEPGPVDESVENLVGNLRTQYLGSPAADETFAAEAKITGLLLQKTM